LATDADFRELENLAKRPKVIAWGEIGLDYFYDHSPTKPSKQVFLRQLELAKAATLPIVIHCRPSQNSENAWDDCLRLLREHWAANGLGVSFIVLLELGASQAGSGHGFYDFFCREPHLSQAQQIREAAREVRWTGC